MKAVLVNFSNTEAGRNAMRAAITVARVFKANLRVLYVLHDPTLSSDLLGGGMPASDIAAARAESLELARADAARSRAEMAAILAAAGVPLTDGPPPADRPSATWMLLDGAEEDVLAEASRLNDLIVMPRPGDEAGTDLELVERALFDSRRPVLMIPSSLTGDFGRRVVIAWNGTAQAARAASRALPFLARAEAVTVLRIRSGVRKGPPAEDLVAYLACHGVRADIVRRERAESGVGDQLLAECGSLGADMLVLGVRSQTRLRDWILGNVTKRILTSADLRVFASD